MKLNFWQWIGVVLLILGAGLWIYERQADEGERVGPPSTVPPPTTQE
jgi:hypothetical protein